jgi:hypothetical protein
LTTDNGRFTVGRARLAPAMISTPGHRASRRRQREACQPGAMLSGAASSCTVKSAHNPTSVRCKPRRAKAVALDVISAPVPANNKWFRGLTKLTVAGNWKFESAFLQRTVRVSRDIPLLRRKPGRLPRVCGAEHVARSGETGMARSYRADGRQYLCRAKFQYRSVDEGDGLMRRIGQRPSRARSADCARHAVDVRVGSNISRATSVARARPAADASAPAAYLISMRR